MAHRSREPGRLERFKKTRPRDRGEKYVAPMIDGDLEPEPATGGTITAKRRRHRLERLGEAHELLLHAKPAALRKMAEP